MSFLIGEVVNDLKWGLLSRRIQESLARAMSEVLQDQPIVQKLGVRLEITGDVFVQSTPKLTPSHSQLELELELKAVFSIQPLLPVESAQSSLSMPES
jgi:hypothetical protein